MKMYNVIFLIYKWHVGNKKLRIFSHQFNHQKVTKEKKLAFSWGFCSYSNKNRDKFIESVTDNNNKNFYS